MIYIATTTILAFLAGWCFRSAQYEWHKDEILKQSPGFGFDLYDEELCYSLKKQIEIDSDKLKEYKK